MKKLKTKKAILKRFKITVKGKLLRRRQNSRHLRRKKSKSQKSRFKKVAYVDSVFAKKFIKLINQ